MIGTTGLGVHLTVPVQDKLNGRIGFNTLNYDYSGNTADASYDFKLKLQTVDALVDYFPTASKFRLTAGLVYNGNKISATAKPTTAGVYTYQGNTYIAAQVGQINADIDFNKVAPYLGIGFGDAVAKGAGWSFAGDFGLMFSGSPKSSLRNTGCTAGALLCNRLTADLARENVVLQDEVKGLRYYPVLRVGASYKF